MRSPGAVRRPGGSAVAVEAFEAPVPLVHLSLSLSDGVVAVLPVEDVGLRVEDDFGLYGQGDAVNPDVVHRYEIGSEGVYDVA